MGWPRSWENFVETLGNMLDKNLPMDRKAIIPLAR
jgi:hypothetical protein